MSKETKSLDQLATESRNRTLDMVVRERMELLEALKAIHEFTRNLDHPIANKVAGTARGALSKVGKNA